MGTAFLGAASNASVAETLLGSEDLTIFAPSNSAFQDIGSLTGNLTMDMLADILSYHVIEGTVAYSSDLSNTSLTTRRMPMLEMRPSPREVSLPSSTPLSMESSPTGMIWRRSGTTPSTMSSVLPLRNSPSSLLRLPSTPRPTVRR